MRAALLVEPGHVVVDDVPEPSPGPGEVRVAVGGVGLCGSDLSVFSGRWTAPEYPWIQGHEAFGTVEVVGPGVSADRIGQTVAIEPNAACGRCDQCALGRTSGCRQRRSLGMNRPGALAEKLVVPAEYAWPIDGLDPTDLVCVEPLTVVETALRRLATPLPDAALVLGVGSQGLLMTRSLLRRGVAVEASDVNTERLAFAGQLGASVSEGGDSAPPVDLVVDTVGSPATMEVALARLASHGTILVLGLDSRPFEISAQTVVRRQLVLQGSLTYDHPVDFAATVALLQGERIEPGRVITDEFPLEEAQRAFDASADTRGKSWIRVASLA